MKILFCASEAYPFAKSGGLADVAHALPKALSESEEVTLMLPLYRFADVDASHLEAVGGTTLSFGGAAYEVSFYHYRADGLSVIFVKNPLLYERDTLYGADGKAYADNDLRFTLFSRAIVWYAVKEGIDILHLNDWHTALAALFAKERGLDAKVVFTIHNLAFQGVFEKVRLSLLGIDTTYFHPEALEFYDQINFMKAGIAFCDLITTVSPSYAKEIQTPSFGCGLDGFLRKHADKLIGILNGIDTSFFDPRNDPMIACPMKRKISTFKRCNKKGLFKKEFDDPLFVFIGRLTEQKGVDLLIALGESLAELPLRFAFLGEGDHQTQLWLRRICEMSDNMIYFEGYDEARAHQLYAAADFLVMPSRFEPCGLNQMIAMHYGAVPIVHAVGGLRDTVHADGFRCGLGIPYETNSEEQLLEKISEALFLYEARDRLDAINRFNMVCDFSVERSARKYLAAYRELLA
jgi:starch synthase